MEKACFVKFTNGFNNRAQPYQIATKIAFVDENLCVIKEGLTEAAKLHIRNIHEKTQALQLPEPFRTPVITLDSGRLVSRYIEGKTVNATLRAVLHDKDLFIERLRLYVGFLRQALGPYVCERSAAAFEGYFGCSIDEPTEYCTLSNIDLTFDNIVVQGEVLYIIDNEWIFDFPVPYAFILFRVLCNAYTANAEGLHHLGLGVGELLDLYGIGQYKELFSSMDRAFLRKVYDFDERALQAFRHGFESLQSSLFVDSGEGFSEEHKRQAFAQIAQDDEQEMIYTFAFEPSPQHLRWDPLEGTYCRCHVVAVTASDREFTVQPVNAVRTAEGDVFYSKDPQYLLQGEMEGVSSVTIRAHIQPCEQQTVVDVVANANAGLGHELNQVRKNLYDTTVALNQTKELNEQTERRALLLEQENSKIIAVLNHLQEDMNRIHSSHTWKIMSALSKLKRSILRR